MTQDFLIAVKLGLVGYLFLLGLLLFFFGFVKFLLKVFARTKGTKL